MSFSETQRQDGLRQDGLIEENTGGERVQAASENRPRRCNLSSFYLRRTTAYTRIPEPTSKAAAGRSTAPAVPAVIPPLGGSGIVASLSTFIVSSIFALGWVSCAKAIGTRIIRATIAAKTR